MLASENTPTSYFDLSPYLKKPNLRLPNLNSNADKMAARRSRSSAILKPANPLLVVKASSDFQSSKQLENTANHFTEPDSPDIGNSTLSYLQNIAKKQQRENNGAERNSNYALPRPLRTNSRFNSIRTPKEANNKSSSFNKTEFKAGEWNTESEASLEYNQTGLQSTAKWQDYMSSFDPEATPTIKGNQDLTSKKNSRLKANVLPLVNSPYQIPSQEAKSPVKTKIFASSPNLLKGTPKLNHTISEGERIMQTNNSKIDESNESPLRLQKSSEKRSPNPRVKILRKAIQGPQNHISFDQNLNFTGTIPSYLNTSVKVESPLKAKENRIVVGFSQKTRAGKLPGKPFKPNQDSFITHANFCGHKDKFIFAVCDGHGINGHLVSGFLKTNLAKCLEFLYKTSQNKNTTDLIKQSFSRVDKQLNSSAIDTLFSGSTAVSVFIFGTQLWCANVGDSRAVLAKFTNDTWNPFPLSTDHKPGIDEEYNRILQNGGRVEPFRDVSGGFVGPDRVWLKNENIPGLAMSRSLGDKIASSVGVISEPEILNLELAEEDKFIIIGSDGLWEFLSNEQVIDIFRPYYLKNQLELGCNALVKKAVECWNKLDDMVDDITCVAISLKVPPKYNQE